MLDSICIERAASADDAVHDVPFTKQQLRQIRTVLTGDAGDQGLLSLLIRHAIDEVNGHLRVMQTGPCDGSQRYCSWSGCLIDGRLDRTVRTFPSAFALAFVWLVSTCGVT